MITIQSAESALKNIFLESAINDINTKTNPFLAMINKNTKTASSKEARSYIRYGNRGSVVVGEEGGELPVNAGAKTIEIVTPLKNLYGTFQITDKAIRAAQNNAGAFANLLAGEMKNLVASAQLNLNQMLFGNGMNYLGHTEAHNFTNKNLTLPARYIGNFKVGDTFKLLNANNVVVGESLEVASITDNVINFTGATIIDNRDRFYLYSLEDESQNLNGIDAIFRSDKMYNLTPQQFAPIKPYIKTSTSTTTGSVAVTESEIFDFLNKIEDAVECNPIDVIMTHLNVRRAIYNELRGTHANAETDVKKSGVTTLTFNGVPVYADSKCKGGTAYALSSDNWAIHQLCDWTWLSGDDGGVLARIDGKAGYSASLVKYADLLCSNPAFQGKMTLYSANKVV